MVPGGFAPKRDRTHRVRTHIDSTSDQVLKIYLSLIDQKSKKDNIVGIMKQNHTEHVYFSFFSPLKVKANSKQN
jgi:hypothetical protein